MAAGIISSTLTPAAKSYVKGMSDFGLLWMTLQDRLSPRQKPAHQQTLHAKFDLLAYNEKEDINFYFEKLRDYQLQYSLDGTTPSITNGGLVSKVPLSLLLLLKSRIRQLADNGSLAWAVVEKLVGIEMKRLSFKSYTVMREMFMIVLAKYKQNYLSTRSYYSFSPTTPQQNKTNKSQPHTQPPRSRYHSFVGTESFPT